MTAFLGMDHWGGGWFKGFFLPRRSRSVFTFSERSFSSFDPSWLRSSCTILLYRRVGSSKDPRLGYGERSANLDARLDIVTTRLQEALQTLQTLQTQLRGGVGDPRTDPQHPGHWLLRLGWHYHGEGEDPYGCNWEDPACKGTGCRECVTLPVALGRALSRILDRPNAFQLLDDGHDGV